MTHEIPSETPEEEAAREARNATLPSGALPEPSPSDLIDGVRQVALDLVNSGITEANGRLTDKGQLYFMGEQAALEQGLIDAQGNVTEKGRRHVADMNGDPHPKA